MYFAARFHKSKVLINVICVKHLSRINSMFLSQIFYYILILCEFLITNNTVYRKYAKSKEEDIIGIIRRITEYGISQKT
ncbi:LOW QUALITY PROTEIN: hypothetical protein V1477_006900 [Vespula maculifrons]|uniref:Uncharacterized protein n=1 Tax=Vespula maculifrons TaxID=7453 RepID=A0ABD2CH01_VESMC